MAIKVSQLNAEREHRAEAVLTIEGADGHPQKQPVDVIFRGKSVATGRRLREAIGQDGMYQYVDFLEIYLIRLEIGGQPALVDDNGQPVSLTKDLLNTWTVENVTAIHDAISETLDPNPQPSEA